MLSPNPIELIIIFDNYARNPTAFSTEDVFYDLEKAYSLEFIDTALITDGRFFSLGTNEGESIFISQYAVFSWYYQISLHCGKMPLRKFFIKNAHLLGLFYSAMKGTHCPSLPTSIINYGCNYGFILPAANENSYFLPVAYFCSLIYRGKYKFPDYRALLKGFNNLSGLSEIERSHIINIPMDDWLNDAFDINNLSDKRATEFFILKEGLNGNDKHTLEEIAVLHKLTRERVRQIIGKISRKLQNGSISRSILIQGLLCYLLKNKGKLTFRENNRLLILILNILNIEFTHLPDSVYMIMGNQNESVIKLTNILFNSDFHPNNNNIRKLVIKYIYLSKTDVDIICETLNNNIIKNYHKYNKVTYALSVIGRPAHYSSIYSKLLLLFPDLSISEKSVLAILDRLTKRNNNQVVWIGIKGTYALKKWGYEKPSKKLFDTITEIVNNYFEKNNKPISRNRVIIELSNYRKIVNPTSIIFALTLNPCIVEVAHNQYIPRKVSEVPEEPVFDDFIDQAIQDFRDDNGKQD
jgi:hypothetical protein